MTLPTPKLRPKADLFDPIAKLIADTYDVQSYFGNEHLANNKAPPRYVWVPSTGTTGGASNVGGEPRSLLDVRMEFDIHCWGQDFDESWNLLTVLMTALTEKFTANFDTGSIDALPTELNLKGSVLTLPVTVTLPVYEVPLDFPTYTTAQATNATQSADFTDP